MMRLLPRSLFGRLVLVLLGGLTVAQLAGGLLHLDEQVQSAYRASGLQAARSVAAAVQVLDQLPESRRAEIAVALGGPSLEVHLGVARDSHAKRSAPGDGHPVMFERMLRGMLGADRPLTVMGFGPPDDEPAVPMPPWPASDHRTMMRRHMAQGGPRFRIQTSLADGQPVTFDYRHPGDTTNQPLRFLAVLAVLLVSVIVVSLLAVRWITRPLTRLANAAEALGRDVRRPPLDENGPTEVARAARAFNTMQRRIVQSLDQRTRFLAGLSHDLRTPITRLRLRNEFVAPIELREKFAADLDEMERMVGGTLELLRGAGNGGSNQHVDLQALLETLQADAQERGAEVAITGQIGLPIQGDPLALKRCFDNLLGNALRYGERAWVAMQDQGGRIVVDIDDDGPGIPAEERSRVFEPFYRVENSRSRETGGTGLGLTIALDVVEALHGRIELGESSHGGLRVRVEIPR